MAKIGFADIRKAVKWGETVAVLDENGAVRAYHGVAFIGSDQIDDDTAGAISEIKQTKEGISIKMHDKRAALVDLGRHLGMFNADSSGGSNVTIKVVGGLPE